jgi:hypothetical protein
MLRLIEFRPSNTRPLGAAFLLCSLAALASACSSQERLTSEHTPCGTREVKIVNSEFARRGVTTAWCAECKGKLYVCATNADRTRVECHPSTAEDVCH